MSSRVEILEGRIEGLPEWKNEIEYRVSKIDGRSLATEADVKMIVEKIDALHDKFDRYANAAIGLLKWIARGVAVMVLDWLGWAISAWWTRPISKIVDPSKVPVLLVLTAGAIYLSTRYIKPKKEKHHGKRTNHSE